MIIKPCSLCGSADFKCILEQDCQDRYLSLISDHLNQEARSIVICTQCGFIYHSPTLTKKELNTLYSKYRDISFRGETPDEYFDRITSIPKEDSLNYKKTVQINRLVKQFLPEKETRTIYDVGTGGGVFLKTFLDNADGEWEAFGVEPTVISANLAARRLSIPVKNEFYRQGLYEIKFDLITANKVVEHAPNTIVFLKNIYHDVKDEGIIYIEVPNAKEIFTLPPDHDQLLYDHLYFFSDKVFEYICDQAGLEVVWMDQPQHVGGDIDLIVVLKKKKNSLTRNFEFPLQRYEDFF